MAEAGTIDLRRDGFDPPPILFPDYAQRVSGDLLQLPVYPCHPSKREATIAVWIHTSILAPQHIYYHDEGGAVYYEIPHRFIHRIGAEPGGKIEFDPDRRIHRQAGLKDFDYIVVGDCTTLEGLAAPYDEEDTRHV